MKVTVRLAPLNIQGTEAIKSVYKEPLNLRERMFLRMRKIKHERSLLSSVLYISFEIQKNGDPQIIRLLKQSLEEFTQQTLAKHGAFPEDYEFEVLVE